jgi:hypothetical protein
MTRRSNLPTLRATVPLAGGLSACAGAGPPDDVSAACDGPCTGASTTEAGACKNCDITMAVTDGALDGTASGGPYRVDISGYVREGGRVKGSFRSSGASVGDRMAGYRDLAERRDALARALAARVPALGPA